jgi:hypothetical protein
VFQLAVSLKKSQKSDEKLAVAKAFDIARIQGLLYNLTTLNLRILPAFTDVSHVPLHSHIDS